MFKELNSTRTIKEGIKLEDLEFRKLKDFIGEDLAVDGFFFTNGDYGKQLVVVARTLGKVHAITQGAYKVNMPNRAIHQFEAIADDKGMVKAVLEGHLLITGIAEGKLGRGTTTLYTLEDC